MEFEYVEQPTPDGLAQAFILGEEFIGNDDVCLILGDNIFYGAGIQALLQEAVKNASEGHVASIFGYNVQDPQRYGVVEFEKDGRVLSIEEKPVRPKSNYAVVGLYFYPNSVVDIAKNCKPSSRGELEITSVNQIYLEENRLKISLMGRGYAWLDTGTQDSLLEASNFIQTIEKRQSLKVACIEEIAFERGYISKEELLQLANDYRNNEYGRYLQRLSKTQM
jgi:glucose-1-phosphate thymidylyltransferase